MVNGSTSAPSTAITITGDGIEVTGPFGVERRGGLQVTFTASGAIVLQGGFPAWVASTVYAVGAVVVPTSLNGAPVPLHGGWDERRVSAHMAGRVHRYGD